MKHLLAVVIAAVVVGALTGAAVFGAYYGLAGIVAANWRLLIVFVLLALGAGYSAATWFENSSGYSGLEVVVPLAVISAGTLLGVAYGLCVVTMKPAA
jgi:hypothetical protein